MESLVLKDVTHTLAQKKSISSTRKKKTGYSRNDFLYCCNKYKKQKKAIPLKIVQR